MHSTSVSPTWFFPISLPHKSPVIALDLENVYGDHSYSLVPLFWGSCLHRGPQFSDICLTQPLEITLRNPAVVKTPKSSHDLPLSCLLPRASIFLLMVTWQHKWIHLSQSAGFSLAQMLGGEKWRDVESQGSSGCLAWSKLLCPNGTHFPPELKKGVWNVLCWPLLALIITTIVCIPTSHTHSSLRVWPWIIHPLTGQSSDRW